MILRSCKVESVSRVKQSNDKDLLLQNIRANKEGLIAKVLPPTLDVESDSRLVIWDIVLDKG